MSWVPETAGRNLARFLSKPVQQSNLITTVSQEQLNEHCNPQMFFLSKTILA